MKTAEVGRWGLSGNASVGLVCGAWGKTETGTRAGFGKISVVSRAEPWTEDHGSPFDVGRRVSL